MNFFLASIWPPSSFSNAILNTKSCCMPLATVQHDWYQSTLQQKKHLSLHQAHRCFQLTAPVYRGFSFASSTNPRAILPMPSAAMTKSKSSRIEIDKYKFRVDIKFHHGTGTLDVWLPTGVARKPQERPLLKNHQNNRSLRIPTWWNGPAQKNKFHGECHNANSRIVSCKVRFSILLFDILELHAQWQRASWQLFGNGLEQCIPHDLNSAF